MVVRKRSASSSTAQYAPSWHPSVQYRWIGPTICEPTCGTSDWKSLLSLSWGVRVKKVWQRDWLTRTHPCGEARSSHQATHRLVPKYPFSCIFTSCCCENACAPACPCSRNWREGWHGFHGGALAGAMTRRSPQRSSWGIHDLAVQGETVPSPATKREVLVYKAASLVISLKVTTKPCGPMPYWSHPTHLHVA